MQVSLKRQQLQPHCVSPAVQRSTQAPSTQTCVQPLHMGVHEAAAHWNCVGVAGFVLMLHVRPVGQLPGQ